MSYNLRCSSNIFHLVWKFLIYHNAGLFPLLPKPFYNQFPNSQILYSSNSLWIPYYNPGSLDLVDFPHLHKATIFSKKSIICGWHDLPFFLFSIHFAETIILLGLSVVLECSWNEMTAFIWNFIWKKSLRCYKNSFEIFCKTKKWLHCL